MTRANLPLCLALLCLLICTAAAATGGHGTDSHSPGGHSAGGHSAAAPKNEPGAAPAAAPAAPAAAPVTPSQATGGFNPTGGNGASAGGTALAGAYTLLYTFPGKGKNPRCGSSISLSSSSATITPGDIKIGGATCTGSALAFKDGTRVGFDVDATHSMLDKGSNTGVGPNPGGRAILQELQKRGASFAYAYTDVAGKGGPGLECGGTKYGPGTGYLVFSLDSTMQVPFGTFPPGKRHMYVSAIGYTCIYQFSGAAPVTTPAPGTPGTTPATGVATTPGAPATPPNATAGAQGNEAANTNTTAAAPATCFPGHATVSARRNGGAFETVRMDALQVGDVVRDTSGRESAVYGFSHREREARADFVRIALAGNREIAASAGHFLLRPDGAAVAAGAVRVGSFLADRRGVPLRVRAATGQCARGLYAPLTLSGTLVVDDVAATVYTTALWPAGARAVLLPLRAQFVVRRFVAQVRQFVEAARKLRGAQKAQVRETMLTVGGGLAVKMALEPAATRPIC